MVESYDKEFDKEFEQVNKAWHAKVQEYVAGTGATFITPDLSENFKKEAFEEFFKDNGITDSEEQEAFKKGYDNFILRRDMQEERDQKLSEIYKRAERTMAATGIDAKDEETEKALASKELEEFFKTEGITDPKDQEVWKKDFETYKQRKAEKEAEAKEEEHRAKVEGMYKEYGKKIAAGKTDEKKAWDEVYEDFFKKEGITDPKEKAAWKRDVEAYSKYKGGKDTEAKEETRQKLRDREVAQIWKNAGLKIAAGETNVEKAKAEALEDYLKSKGITDPKEKEAWKKDFETYPQRKDEKEAKARETAKKSGKKILENGVVSKWLSRNKDKLIGGTAAILGTAWTASAVSSAAGMGGLGLLPTIQILGVSSTVFPPALAVGAAAVAVWYLGKHVMRKVVEAEMAKGKGETKKGPMPAPRGRDGGR